MKKHIVKYVWNILKLKKKKLKRKKKRIRYVSVAEDPLS